MFNECEKRRRGVNPKPISRVIADYELSKLASDDTVIYCDICNAFTLARVYRTCTEVTAAIASGKPTGCGCGKDISKS